MKSLLPVVTLVFLVLTQTHAFADLPEPNGGPQNPNMEAGRKALEAKDFKAAVGHFSKAVEAEPKRADAHNMLGYSYRKQGTFEIKAVHLEPNTPVNEDLISGLSGALRDCAGWHGTPEVVVRRSDPSELTETLRLALDEETVPPTPGSAKTT
jgi:tetratricopeptide (TPR) repeat protein